MSTRARALTGRNRWLRWPRANSPSRPLETRRPLFAETLERRDVYTVDLFSLAPIVPLSVAGSVPGSQVITASAANAQQMYLGPARTVNGTLIRYSLDLPPEYGQVQISGNLATYTPDPNHPGAYAFTVMSNQYGSTINSDNDYLYNVSTNVWTQTDGKQNFSVSYGGITLRSALTTDRFFTRPDYLVDVNYNIVQKQGGVNVTWTVTNNTTVARQQARFVVPGIELPPVDQLNPVGMRPPTMTDDAWRTYTSGGQTYHVLRAGYFPEEAYSPVTIIQAPQYAVGVSLLYDYKEHWTSAHTQLREDPSGTWSWEATGFVQERLIGNTRTELQPGESRTYTAALRWSPPQDWLFTMAPYKEHYLATYGIDASTAADRDLRPVRAYTMADYTQLSASNPRGYKPDIWSRMQVAGQTGSVETRDYDWQPALEYIIQKSKDQGYERTMLWALAGMFNTYELNYPPINATTWLPGLADDLGDFAATFGADPDIDLGIYWGRSAQVPIMDGGGNWTWDPPAIEPFDYDNPHHLAFMRAEINAMMAMGVDEVGLDAPLRTSIEDRERIWNEMFAANPNLKLMMETDVTDFGHARAGLWFNQDEIYGGPNPVMWYLNPGSEIFVKLTEDVSISGIEDLLRWGYTPVVFHDTLDLATINVANTHMIVNYNGISVNGQVISPPVRNNNPIMFHVFSGGPSNIPITFDPASTGVIPSQDVGMAVEIMSPAATLTQSASSSVSEPVSSAPRVETAIEPVELVVAGNVAFTGEVRFTSAMEPEGTFSDRVEPVYDGHVPLPSAESAGPEIESPGPDAPVAEQAPPPSENANDSDELTDWDWTNIPEAIPVESAPSDIQEEAIDAALLPDELIEALLPDEGWDQADASAWDHFEVAVAGASIAALPGWRNITSARRDERATSPTPRA